MQAHAQVGSAQDPGVILRLDPRRANAHVREARFGHPALVRRALRTLPGHDDQQIGQTLPANVSSPRRAFLSPTGGRGFRNRRRKLALRRRVVRLERCQQRPEVFVRGPARAADQHARPVRARAPARPCWLVGWWVRRLPRAWSEADGSGPESYSCRSHGSPLAYTVSTATGDLEGGKC